VAVGDVPNPRPHPLTEEVHVLDVTGSVRRHDLTETTINNSDDNKYLAPDSIGTGYCFRSISLFVSLSARFRENGWTDLHEIFRKVWGDHGTT